MRLKIAVSCHNLVNFRCYLLITSYHFTHFNCLEISHGLVPCWAISTIWARMVSGSGLPLTKTPPSWLTPVWLPSATDISYHYVTKQVMWSQRSALDCTNMTEAGQIRRWTNRIGKPSGLGDELGDRSRDRCARGPEPETNPYSTSINRLAALGCTSRMLSHSLRPLFYCHLRRTPRPPVRGLEAHRRAVIVPENWETKGFFGGNERSR